MDKLEVQKYNKMVESGFEDLKQVVEAFGSQYYIVKQYQAQQLVSMVVQSLKDAYWDADRSSQLLFLIENYSSETCPNYELETFLLK